MSDTSFDPARMARSLALAWQGADRLATAQVPVADDSQAYAVQDALLAQLGPLAGWKVGAASDTAEPNCAPLPASCLYPSGAAPGLPPRSMRGIEVEVAVRLRADLLPGDRLPTREEVAAAIGEIMPAIEVVDTRLAQGRGAPAAAKLADLQSHGALVLGPPAGVDPQSVRMDGLHVRLVFNGEAVLDAQATHPAPDIWRLLAWLARHAQARGLPLRAGHVVTTGSCSGLLFAPAGARVEAELGNLGRVSMRT